MTTNNSYVHLKIQKKTEKNTEENKKKIQKKIQKKTEKKFCLFFCIHFLIFFSSQEKSGKSARIEFQCCLSYNQLEKKAKNTEKMQRFFLYVFMHFQMDVANIQWHHFYKQRVDTSYLDWPKTLLSIKKSTIVVPSL